MKKIEVNSPFPENNLVKQRNKKLVLYLWYTYYVLCSFRRVYNVLLVGANYRTLHFVYALHSPLLLYCVCLFRSILSIILDVFIVVDHIISKVDCTHDRMTCFARGSVRGLCKV